MDKFNNLIRITVGRIQDLNTIRRTIPGTLLYYCPFIGEKIEWEQRKNSGWDAGSVGCEAKLSFIILDSRECKGG
jgi:hypothetical protein